MLVALCSALLSFVLFISLLLVSSCQLRVSRDTEQRHVLLRVSVFSVFVGDGLHLNICYIIRLTAIYTLWTSLFLHVFLERFWQLRLPLWNRLTFTVVLKFYFSLQKKAEVGENVPLTWSQYIPVLPVHFIFVDFLRFGGKRLIEINLLRISCAILLETGDQTPWCCVCSPCVAQWYTIISTWSIS